MFPGTVAAVPLRQTAECAGCHMPASALWQPSGRWPRPSSDPGAAPQDSASREHFAGIASERPSASAGPAQPEDKALHAHAQETDHHAGGSEQPPQLSVLVVLHQAAAGLCRSVAERYLSATRGVLLQRRFSALMQAAEQH